MALQYEVQCGKITLFHKKEDGLGMRYFEKQCSDMSSVWGLFAVLGSSSYREEILRKDRRCDYSHVPEIINSAINGNIYGSPEEFNLRAYEIACMATDDIKEGKRRSKMLSIKDDVNADDSVESSIGYGEISINDRRLESIEEAFAIIENNEVFEECLKDLLNLRSEYIVEKGYDVVELVSSSLKGIPEAIKSVGELASEDNKLKDILSVLCSNSSGNLLRVRLEGAL